MVSLNSEEDTEEEDEEIEDDSSVLLPSMRIITKRGNITYITYDNDPVPLLLLPPSAGVPSKNLKSHSRRFFVPD